MTYVIAKVVDVLRSFDTLDLPDAEHIHVTRHPDDTITAVPMRQVPRAAWDDNGIVTSLTGELRHREGQQPMWVDSPGGAA